MPVWLALKAAQFLGLPWVKWLKWLLVHPAIVLAVAGTLFGLYERHGKLSAVKRLDACNARSVAMLRASDANAKAQAEQKAQIEQQSRKDAQRVQDQHDDQMADALDVGERYKRAHSVRLPAPNFGTTPAAPHDHGSGVPQEAPGAALVAITPDDFDRCTALGPYAVGAFDFIQTIPGVK